jgi:hypothetical protein
LAGVGEVKITGSGAEETGAARDIGITDEHVGRHPLGDGAALVRDDGPSDGINGGAADDAAGVHAVGGGGVFVDHVVVHGAHGGDAIHERSGEREVFADADAGDGGRDGVVVGAGDFFLRVAAALGIEGVDLAHAAAEPDGDDVLGFAFEEGGGRGGVGGGRRGAREGRESGDAGESGSLGEKSAAESFS